MLSFAWIIFYFHLWFGCRERFKNFSLHFFFWLLEKIKTRDLCLIRCYLDPNYGLMLEIWELLLFRFLMVWGKIVGFWIWFFFFSLWFLVIVAQCNWLELIVGVGNWLMLWCKWRHSYFVVEISFVPTSNLGRMCYCYFCFVINAEEKLPFFFLFFRTRRHDQRPIIFFH